MSRSAASYFKGIPQEAPLKVFHVGSVETFRNSQYWEEYQTVVVVAPSEQAALTLAANEYGGKASDWFASEIDTTEQSITLIHRSNNF